MGVQGKLLLAVCLLLNSNWPLLPALAAIMLAGCSSPSSSSVFAIHF